MSTTFEEVKKMSKQIITIYWNQFYNRDSVGIQMKEYLAYIFLLLCSFFELDYEISGVAVFFIALFPWYPMLILYIIDTQHVEIRTVS